MHRRHFFTLGAAVAGLALAGCSRNGDSNGTTPAAPAGLSPEEGLSTIAAQGKGFAVGAAEGAPTVHVFFDPQCPHCGRQWQAAQPLLPRIRMVWLPVAFINVKSKAQGAALLSAGDPRQAMTAHETSLLANQGGMAAPSTVSAELDAAIERNTELLGRLGADSVPFLIARNASGQAITHVGRMETDQLAQWLGVAP